jgi:hypothetical protein
MVKLKLQLAVFVGEFDAVKVILIIPTPTIEPGVGN